MGVVRRSDSRIRPPRGVLRQRRLVCFGRRVPFRDLDPLQGRLIDIERMMTSGEVTVAVYDEWRLALLAHVGRVPAARMEAAIARRVDRARHLALEYDPLPLREPARNADPLALTAGELVRKTVVVLG